MTLDGNCFEERHKSDCAEEKALHHCTSCDVYPETNTMKEQGKKKELSS